MHDPMTVAFEVPVPLPRVVPEMGKLATKGPRWGLYRWRTDLGTPVVDQWWRPSAWWLRLGGRRIRMRSGVTVWHVEPGGRDSGQVCKHYRRSQRPDGSWETVVLHGWRWHVHHWHIQVPALQELRRTLLTRCAWCGGTSRKRARVNVSHAWDGPRGRWWQGAPGLFHVDCSSASNAARSCTCSSPILDRDGWGTCARCGLGYGYGRKAHVTAVLRLLKQCPAGQRPSAELMAQVKAARDAGRKSSSTNRASP